MKGRKRDLGGLGLARVYLAMLIRLRFCLGSQHLLELWRPSLVSPEMTEGSIRRRPASRGPGITSLPSIRNSCHIGEAQAQRLGRQINIPSVDMCKHRAFLA